MNISKEDTAAVANEGIVEGDKSALQSSLESRDFRLEALNHILASGFFRASERNKQFLKFVVEETIAGRSSRIKAFTVAVDVFGRDASFDASVDPIVRIAAGHLRRSLEEYYSGKGKGDSVRIILPLGTYVPVFLRQEKLPQRMMAHLRRVAVERQSSLQSGTVSVALALAGAALGAAYFFTPFGSVKDVTPVVVVDKAQSYLSDENSEAFASLFTQSLWIALSGNEGFRVVGVRTEENLDQVLARTEASFGEGRPLYQLLSTVRREGDELRVYWHVLDGRSSESYLSASTTRDIKAQADLATPGQLAQDVATSINRLSALTANHKPKD